MAGTPPVSIWHARTSEIFSCDGDRARARRWLTAEDALRYERYRHDVDRDMFLLGRVMARALVGRALSIDPASWTWREGPRGRPEVEGPVSFNLAHSAGVVVCAVSRDGRVGVDVEHRARPPVDARMVRRYCAPPEVADIERQGAAWQDQFLKYWTLKEAYLKARGLGIAVHLADLSFTIGAAGISLERLNRLADDADWSFVLDAPGGSHYVAAAVAVSDRAAPPSFLLAPFPADLLP